MLSAAVLREQMEAKKGATDVARASRTFQAWEYSRSSAEAKAGSKKRRAYSTPN